MITVNIHLHEYDFEYVASSGRTKYVSGRHKDGSYGGFTIFVDNEAAGHALVDALRQSQADYEKQAA